ncbi:MAG: two pore domain potassium channel family protein [Desulfuromonadaceae bacterium]|nr:two pore domain potassium channel family protein [Desulfuromonadaceae bacterium]
MKNSLRQLRFYLLAFCAVIALSTLCFMLTEHLNFGEALYFSIVTISSVGYGDILPKTDAGRLFAMIFIVLGAITFLSLVGRATELMLNRRDDEVKRKKLHMLVGVFLGEIGQPLLEMLVRQLRLDEKERQKFIFSVDWSARDFRELSRQTTALSFSLSDPLELMKHCSNLLPEVKPLLIRLLENPAVLEHSAFSELLLAVFHFEQELACRKELDQLPQADLHHLTHDGLRVYRLMLPQWLDYLEHLQQDYPYLYSLQVRINPFHQSPTAVIPDTL